MSHQSPVCAQLSEHVHNMLFAFAGRSYKDSYFTVYQLDNGTRETRLCNFPNDPHGMYVTDYAAEMVKSIADRGHKITGFAMFLSQQEQGGIYHWWSLATDEEVNLDAVHYVPFTNEDGVFDYMALLATPKCEEDKAAIRPLLEATDAVWQLACENGAADIELALTNLAAVPS